MALVLSGCARGLLDRIGYHPDTPATPIYWRAKATNEELQRDLAGCRMQVAMLPTQQAPYQRPESVGESVSNLGAALNASDNRDQFFSDCMRVKGWSRQ